MYFAIAVAVIVAYTWVSHMFRKPAAPTLEQRLLGMMLRRA